MTDENLNKLIHKIEHERDFQQEQAKDFSCGVFKSEILYARYDASAKMLDWVLNLLKGGAEK